MKNEIFNIRNERLHAAVPLSVRHSFYFAICAAGLCVHSEIMRFICGDAGLFMGSFVLRRHIVLVVYVCNFKQTLRLLKMSERRCCGTHMRIKI